MRGAVTKKTGLWALVLAAGAGSRFGGDKLRAPWGEGRLIDATLATARAAPVEGVMLLHRPGDRLTDDPEIRMVEVPDWSEGMAASLRRGVAALPPDCTGAYVILGDMPRIPGEVLQPLADAVSAGAPAAAPVWAEEHGHPVLFARRLFPELLRLTGDRGGRAVIQALGDRLARVAAPDNGVLFDVDTREGLGPGE